MNDMDAKETNPNLSGTEILHQDGEAGAEAGVAESVDAVAAALRQLEDAKAEITALKAENAELKDKWLRAKAETENVLRRSERDKADWTKYAISEFARDVILIGDNLRRAIEAVPKDAVLEDPNLKTLLDGVEVTERELIKSLERQNVIRFNPKGEKFDPHIHEAMMRIETSDQPPETVVQVIQAGYMIGERVLRPAAVIVAKERTSPMPGNGDEEAGSGPVAETVSNDAAGEQAETETSLSASLRQAVERGDDFQAAPVPLDGFGVDDSGEAYGNGTVVRMPRRKGNGFDAAGEKLNGSRSANLGTSVLNGKRRSAMVKPVIPPASAVNGDLAYGVKLNFDDE